jgi:hypothetical protein
MLIAYGGGTRARILEVLRDHRILVMVVDNGGVFGGRGDVVAWIVTESMLVISADDISQRLSADVQPKPGMRVVYPGFGEFEILDAPLEGRMRIRYTDGTRSGMWVDSDMRLIRRTIVMAEDFTFMRQCADCGRLAYIDGSLRNPSDEPVCAECYDESYEACEHCGRVFDRSEMTVSDSGSYYCYDCYATLYTRCERCSSELLLSEALNFDEHILCESCHDVESASDDADEDNGVIHYHGYKPKPIFHGGGSEMFYGMELELECEMNARSNVADSIADPKERDWHLGEDGSLSNGIEIITHPRTFESWEAFWPEFDERALKKARKLGCTGHNGTCGMHIHTSLDAWGSEQLYRLFALVYDSSNYRNLLIVSQRGEDQLRRWASLDIADVGRYKAEIVDKRRPFEDRYAALNITATTLEFRIFRSNLRLERVRKNMEFVRALYCYTGSVKQQATWTGLMRWVKRHKDQAGNLFRFLVEKGVISEEKEKTKVKQDAPLAAAV